MPRKFFISFLICLSAGFVRAEDAAIDWQPWSEDVFAQAKKENRYVLLDLGAVWCHWCHVMEEVTYRDPKVVELIKARYIAVRVDQDSRPDLSNRYEEYGWPATVVFAADGSEIVKRQGYLPPKMMASMLQAIIDDPSPGPSVTNAGTGSVSSTGRMSDEAFRKTLSDAYDTKNGGWNTVHKFMDWEMVEYCLAGAVRGDASLERMARGTLDAQLALIDPVWGGVYQYSTDGDWQHPHFEKLLQFQAEDLRTYAQADALWNDPRYLRAAESIGKYLHDFLTSPEGAFYTSQDADLVPGEHSADYYALDDAARRKLGIPRVDQHIYARENGWAINALAAYSAATGDPESLRQAVKAADWIIAHRSLPGGGFRHDEKDVAGPYLGDTVSMGRAFLALYEVTAERKWLERAVQAAHFINEHFKSETGFLTTESGGLLKANPQIDENIAVARLANLLSYYSSQDDLRPMAEHALRYLSAPQIVEKRGLQAAGILIAMNESASPPIHVTVVGEKTDPAARALFQAVLKFPGNYKRLDWWDKREGPLLNPDVDYPGLKKAAAFICSGQSCSTPVFTPEKLFPPGPR